MSMGNGENDLPIVDQGTSGSDPLIYTDDGTIPHEERDSEGRVIRERNEHIPILERETPFTEEEAELIENAKTNRNILGLTAIGLILWQN